MRDPRLTKLAQVLVNYSVGITPGKLVRITGPTVAAPLVSELYRQVIAAGGYPWVRLALEELDEILFKHAGDDQLQYLNPIAQVCD